MKKTSAWCLLGLLALGSASLSHAQQSSGATAKAVLALENQWLQSQKTNNPDLVAPLLADTIVSTGNDGKVENKAQMLADAKSRKYDSADYEDVHVMVYGNTAIVTGGFKGKGTDPSGKPFNDHDRWTDTWFKMPDGKWQCIATEDTAIKM
jgi:ketosteroid isomerase-like protein